MIQPFMIKARIIHMKLIQALIPLFFIYSCTKDKVQPVKEKEECKIITENFSNQTVTSTDYLMVKPGSWWKFSDSSTWVCDNPDFVPIFSIYDETEQCIYIEKDMIIAPVHPFFKEVKDRYQIINLSGKDETLFKPIYDTTLGEFYNYISYYKADYFKYDNTVTEKRKVIEKLDSFQLNSEIYYDVLHIEHHRSIYWPFTNYTQNTISEFYLAKGVGLIKLNYQHGHDEFEKSLVNYHIEE